MDETNTNETIIPRTREIEMIERICKSDTTRITGTGKGEG